MICETFETVVVPFPFTDKAAAKKRPALVLSMESFNRQGHTVMAMITTRDHRPWPGDCAIEELESAGLRVPCIVRPKLFTLDNRLILRRLGRLGTGDAEKVKTALRSLLCL